MDRNTTAKGGTCGGTERQNEEFPAAQPPSASSVLHGARRFLADACPFCIHHEAPLRFVPSVTNHEATMTILHGTFSP